MAEPLRAVPAHSSADPGILAAQTQDDLVVGEEIVRFRYYTRVVHWGVALTFFLCLFTGLPIWTPIFGWLAPLFGGLTVCRWLHPWTGVAFSVFALLQFVHWAGEMRRTAADKRFTKLGHFLAYMRWQTHDEEVGKFNGGQKSLFWLSSLASLALLATGVVIWLPELLLQPLPRGVVGAARPDLHPLRPPDPRPHLPVHRRAGHVRGDGEGHRDQGLGAPAPPGLVPRRDR